jgi:hydroxymethylpyrimidine kinase/phosphomethylpyrimidine kinase
VFHALGVEGLCAITAVLAADGRVVRRRFAVPPRTVEAQIDAVASGGVDATKIAGLRDRTLVDAIAERVRRRRLQPVVLDPGIVDERGERLLGRNGVEWMRKQLLPQTAVVVLDGVEAAILAGKEFDAGDVGSYPVILEAIRRAGAGAVVMCSPPQGEGTARIADVEGARLLDARVPHWGGPRGRFTAALTARLAMGDSVVEAVGFAIDYV